MKFLKILHLVGMAMFLGSILGHIVVGFVTPAPDAAQTKLFVREEISLATLYLTLPGLGLLLFSGSLLVIGSRRPFLQTRWQLIHVVIAALIGINTLFVLMPVGSELLVLARSSSESTLFGTFETREAVWGAANIVLALLAITIAAVRPSLRCRCHEKKCC